MNVNLKIDSNLKKNTINSTISKNSAIYNVKENFNNNLGKILNHGNSEKDINDIGKIIDILNNEASKSDIKFENGIDNIIDKYSYSKNNRESRILLGEKLFIYANRDGKINKNNCLKVKDKLENYIKEKGLKGNKVVFSEYAKSVYIMYDEFYTGKGIGIDYIFDKTNDIIDYDIGQDNIDLYLKQIDNIIFSLNNINKNSFGEINSKTTTKLELIEKLDIFGKIFAILYSKINSKIGKKYGKDLIKTLTSDILKSKKDEILKSLTHKIIYSIDKRGDEYTKTYKDFLNKYCGGTKDELVKINGITISDIKKTINEIKEINFKIPKIKNKISEGTKYVLSSKDKLNSNEFTNKELDEKNIELKYKAKNIKSLIKDVNDLTRKKEFNYNKYIKAVNGIYKILSEDFDKKGDYKDFINFSK